MKNKDKVILYQFLDNENIPFYIGITNDFKRRKGEHLQSVKKSCKYPVYNKINKLQREEGYILNMQIVKENLTIEEANKLEIETIKDYKEKGIKLYNLSEGGGGRLGFKVVFTDEWKQKLKDAKKKQYEDGYINPSKGIKFSEDRLKQMSEERKEYFKTRQGTFTGKTHTKECRKMFAETAKKTFKGTTQTKEQVRKRIENSIQTKKNWSEEKKIEMNKIYKENALASIKRYNIKTINLINKIEFEFYGTYVELSKHILENYKDKVSAEALGNTFRKLTNSTKSGWQVVALDNKTEKRD